MDAPKSIQIGTISGRFASYRLSSFLSKALSSFLFAGLALGVFYSSLIATSQPINYVQYSKVNDAIDLLETKGFKEEVFLLRHTVAFRGSDNWFNDAVPKEDSYAATNFPFQIITLYPDFYTKTTDDVERAMVLLHEAQHLRNSDEAAAYAFVWQNRHRLGWTQLTHGTTASYITVEQQTREFAPELFKCADKLWNDCTETLAVRR
jgi:hypothetical protein